MVEFQFTIMASVESCIKIASMPNENAIIYIHMSVHPPKIYTLGIENIVEKQKTVADHMTEKRNKYNNNNDNRRLKRKERKKERRAENSALNNAISICIYRRNLFRSSYADVGCFFFFSLIVALIQFHILCMCAK